MAPSSPSLLTAQRVLDELRQGRLIPFPLVAFKMENPAASTYRIRFYDSRLYGIDVDWRPGEDFKELFRAAVLKGLSKGKS